MIDRRGRIAAQRRGPVDQAWLDETLPPLLGRRRDRRASPCSRCCSRSPTGAAPRASLPDIEDEVMCSSAGPRSTSPPPSSPTRSERSSAARSRAGRTSSRSRTRWSRVRARRPRRARPRAGSTSPRTSCPIAAGAARGSRGIAVAARRWRRHGRAAPPPRAEPLGDEDARRLDAELARLRPPMSGGVDTTVVAAFAVGFVSFISPCVLPLVPGYLSAVSGVTLAELQRGERAQRDAARDRLLPGVHRRVRRARHDRDRPRLDAAGLARHARQGRRA